MGCFAHFDPVAFSRTDAPGRRRGRRTDKLLEIAGVLATQAARIERYKRGLSREDRHLIKSQRWYF